MSQRRPLHVFLIAEPYGKPNDGVAVMTATLARALARTPDTLVTIVALRPDGILPHLSDGASGERILSVCLRGKPRASSVRASLAYELRRLLFRNTFARALERARATHDVVAHFHFASEAYGIVHDVLRANDIPYVTTFHGSDLGVALDDTFVAEAMESLVHDAAEVTAVSRALADTARARFRRPALVTHNGVEPPRIPESQPRRDVDVVFVGNLIRRKGVDILLEATAALAPTRSIKVAVIGDGVERAELHEMSRNLGIDRSVEFVGAIPHSTISSWFQRAKIVVVPSRAEPFGLVVVEAQMNGACVIAAEVGGIPEIVESDVTGILVPSENPSEVARAIQSMLDDDTRRKRLAEAGQARSLSEFSASACAAQYLKVYREALDAEPGTRGTNDLK